VRIAKQGSVARTHARCLTLSGSEPKLALLLLQPQTGRRHQLRVQCAHHRLPILGDRTYGDFRQNRQLERRPQIARRLYLHAWALSVELGLDGKTQRFTAQSDPPRAFAQALGMEDLRGELSDAEDRTDTG